jgi:hypothetical protein
MLLAYSLCALYLSVSAYITVSYSQVTIEDSTCFVCGKHSTFGLSVTSGLTSRAADYPVGAIFHLSTMPNGSGGLPGGPRRVAADADRWAAHGQPIAQHNAFRILSGTCHQLMTPTRQTLMNTSPPFTNEPSACLTHLRGLHLIMYGFWAFLMAFDTFFTETRTYIDTFYLFVLISISLVALLSRHWIDSYYDRIVGLTNLPVHLDTPTKLPNIIIVIVTLSLFPAFLIVIQFFDEHSWPFDGFQVIFGLVFLLLGCLYRHDRFHFVYIGIAVLILSCLPSTDLVPRDVYYDARTFIGAFRRAVPGIALVLGGLLDHITFRSRIATYQAALRL